MTELDAPELDFGSLPPDQLEAADAVAQNLRSLRASVQDLRLTLELFEHVRAMPNGLELSKSRGLSFEEISRQMERRAAWLRIAAGHGALVIYGFSKLLEAIDRLLHEAPALKAKVDMPVKKHAKRLFRKSFPNVTDIRTLAAHPRELSSTPAETRRHRETQTGVFMGEGLSINSDGVYYHGTFKGKFVGYAVSIRSAESLETVCNLICKAFYPAEDPIKVRLREQSLGMSRPPDQD